MDEATTIHRHTANNREEILRSSLCVCLYCGRSFTPHEVEDWIDDGNTALCPHCGIDSVVGNASGHEFSRSMIKQLHLIFFSEELSEGK